MVCDLCWQKLPRIKHRVNVDFNKLQIVGFLAVWEFDETFQKIVHEMKFYGKKSLAIRLGKELADLASENADYSSADFIIPVPLHKIKFRERGFNQSLIIAETISTILDIPVNKHVLRRTRYTKPQSKLTAIEREKNVTGAFEATAIAQIKKKNVVVVDDVLTTGSTIKACAEALLNAGVERVFALTAAATI